ncbi:indole-3-glycerol phosphate synthase TrpC [Reichenbachiella versicolor]|uniref:indole-3-glycerol phosphate synthase TrpC n=1 Tax=Reichenbachiella versicolor TaxID=1821036 RepID=UPI000D6E3FC3|nr:indole-3-glycerol phosphate synthase TrpC [Reichenbachiella versicolor]
MNVLDKIVEQKKKEVAEQKVQTTVDALKATDGFQRTGISVVERLQANNSFGIISEFKRQSPSKGIINDSADVSEVTKGYCDAGASAVSILTDEQFFGGTMEDLKRARPHLDCPVLRKDFIIDEYQVYQTKSLGADLMLLIAAILTKEEVVKYTDLAHEIGLEVLLEIHNEEEYNHCYYEKVDVLGVNNRDLKRFKTTIQNSIDLAKILPEEQLKISESGISSIEEMKLLQTHGFKGFLIGESFMRTEDPAAELEKFLSK